MQNMSVKAVVFGIFFASFLWALVVFAFNFESRTPTYSGLDPRFEIYEATVTENQRLVDAETGRTLLWTPGNPKIKVIDVKEVESGRWEVIVEKIY